MPSDPDNIDLVTRRDAIIRVSAMLGGAALIGQSAMLAGCGQEHSVADVPVGENATTQFTSSDIEFLDEVADTILPETSTPGAKAAEVGAFIALMVTDTYYDNDQKVFRDGMQTLDDECQDMHGATFMSATPEQRLALLQKLDAEQLKYMNTRRDDAPAHYFRMIKELALLGYFTSEIGYTQAMRYVETPGQYEPCVPYAPGDKSWAPHA